jgi:hypothetical protein
MCFKQLETDKTLEAAEARRNWPTFSVLKEKIVRNECISHIFQKE